MRTLPWREQWSKQGRFHESALPTRAIKLVRTYHTTSTKKQTDGQRMTPTGPSPRIKGSFVSSSMAIMMSGKQKARVFPEPVNAMPIMSRPEKLMECASVSRCEANVPCTYATGIPCNWIGVGVTMRLDFRYLSIAAGIFMS